jgi:membrane-bound lytic murein transglycosylase D
VVRRGDTLSELARHYGVKVSQLRRWNHLGGNAIRIGQKLTVGAPN